MTQSNDNTVNWIEAIIKWTRYDYVAIYDYPTLKNSEQVMTVYKGDFVQIIKRYRGEDWCLVRAGHVFGWVHLQDVRFITRRGKPPRPKSRSQQPRTPTLLDPAPKPAETAPARHETIAQSRPSPNQTVSQPEPVKAPPPAPSAEKKGTLSAIKRLIGFFAR